MKKLLFAAALIAFASSAWAQDVAKTSIVSPDTWHNEPGNLETVSGWLHHPRPRGAGKPEVLVERPLRRPIEYP
jgi:hypothetical protein